jgi:hypothetical protein
MLLKGIPRGYSLDVPTPLFTCKSIIVLLKNKNTNMFSM